MEVTMKQLVMLRNKNGEFCDLREWLVNRDSVGVNICSSPLRITGAVVAEADEALIKMRRYAEIIHHYDIPLDGGWSGGFSAGIGLTYNGKYWLSRYTTIESELAEADKIVKDLHAWLDKLAATQYEVEI
jgi:hypothetical protein